MLPSGPFRLEMLAVIDAPDGVCLPVGNANETKPWPLGLVMTTY